jgi:hypothetical protein
MLSKGITWIIAITICITLSAALLSLTHVTGQDQAPEKSTRKKFGFSLSESRQLLNRNPACLRELKTTSLLLTSGDVVRINTRLGRLDVRVVDPKGVVVSGLTKNDFVLTQENRLCSRNDLRPRRRHRAPTLNHSHN